MSAQHARASALLHQADRVLDGGPAYDQMRPHDTPDRMVARAQVHALLEAGEQLEALVEMLRPLVEQRVEQGETGHPVVPGLKLRPDLTVCPRCLDPLEGRTVRVTTPGDYVVHEDC